MNSDLGNFIAIVVSLTVSGVLWSEVWVQWQALRQDPTIPALRQQVFAAGCRATAVSLLALLVIDNAADIRLIEGDLPRVVSIVALIVIVLPSVRFLWLYVTHGFRSTTKSVEEKS